MSRRVPARLRTLAIPVAVLICTATVAVVGAALTHQSAVRDADQRLAAEADKVDAAILHRMSAYGNVLAGARGFVEANEGVTREQWRTYVESLDLASAYPGIQGVGWSVVIRPEDLAAHVAEVRAEGFPEYTVWPAGERPLYTAIVFLEPFRDRNLRAFGFDMWSEPVRHEAMARARETGEAALSGRVRLVQETDEDVQPGFLVYVPVYTWREPVPGGARGDLVGFVYAPFRARDLMEGVLGPGTPGIAFAVYDGTVSPETLLVSSQPDGQPFDARERRGLTVAGHTWTIEYGAPPASFGAAVLPLAVLVGGLTIAGLLFGLTLALSRRRERAQELADRMTQELRASRAALERSNAELEHFAYIASHDLREPLRTVSGFIELLRKRHGPGLDAAGHRYLESALQGTRRMHRLVEGLLEYSRLHGERASPRPVALGKVWDEAVQGLQAQVAATSSQVTRDALPEVLGHRDELVRLLQNLVSNAIKYRGSREARVHCSARRDGAFWQVSVRDEGIGIAPEYHGRLFVLFQRLHSHDIEGVGVGLAVCKRIVERHGGRIWIDPTQALGTTIHLTLPAADAPGGTAHGYAAPPRHTVRPGEGPGIAPG